MTRSERILRLARLRGDRAAELIIYAGTCDHCMEPGDYVYGMHRLCERHWRQFRQPWTEAELRAAWGDR